MVKHNQIIRRKQPTNCLSVFYHFVGLALKGLKRIELKIILQLFMLNYFRLVKKNNEKLKYVKYSHVKINLPTSCDFPLNMMVTERLQTLDSIKKALKIYFMVKKNICKTSVL